ncbi:LysM peptidoglycan-binding domain-containing protein [Neobacillus niacini]|uniref:LysM peptidoglycan-binding domain-containing protein n=1 Tax=Neobacillus niacini TaxID=86668 RepID=UPI0009ED7BE8|nr:LysM peptidoglycan-binding domain-containing protein [Neobacillus niacini]MEC1521930.1 LysM peptidoglycan-binding domain-containing protein [Neobacillus niacini]
MRKRLVLVFGIISSMLFLVVSPAQAVSVHPNHIHEVKAGDSLPDIANKYSISIEELKAANGLQSDVLIAGQKLWVPIIYEVKAGDTLLNISSSFHSSVEAIKAINGLTSEQLYSGQLLKVTPKKMNMHGQHILMTKEEFKDWLFNTQVNREIRLIQQHHTWLPSYQHFNGSNHFQMLIGMENHHKKTMRWKNIAQNITTFPDGKVAVSRPLNMIPDGTIGPKANSVGIAIEHVGNFDIGHDVMTKAQQDTIVYINALLCIKFGLTPSIDSITYHHWWHIKTKERVLDATASYNVKSCPGTGFFGGNSTASAKTFFYPLISDKIEELVESMQ